VALLERTLLRPYAFETTSDSTACERLRELASALGIADSSLRWVFADPSSKSSAHLYPPLLAGPKLYAASSEAGRVDAATASSSRKRSCRAPGASDAILLTGPDGEQRLVFVSGGKPADRHGPVHSPRRPPAPTSRERLRPVTATRMTISGGVSHGLAGAMPMQLQYDQFPRGTYKLSVNGDVLADGPILPRHGRRETRSYRVGTRRDEPRARRSTSNRRRHGRCAQVKPTRGQISALLPRGATQAAGRTLVAYLGRVKQKR